MGRVHGVADPGWCSRDQNIARLQSQPLGEGLDEARVSDGHHGLAAQRPPERGEKESADYDLTAITDRNGNSVTFTEGAIIGFIIPGLIAIWYQRQGVLETTLSLLTAAIIVRMVLVVMLGDVAI